MFKIINECVGCPQEMGCLGSSCPNRNIKEYYCDECGDDGVIYELGDMQLCENCMFDYMKKYFKDEIEDIVENFLQEEFRKLKEL